MAKCSGCNTDSKDLSIYNAHKPVHEDGSYANGQFVCDECYCELIPAGLSVGNAVQLQTNIRQLKGKP